MNCTPTSAGIFNVTRAPDEVQSTGGSRNFATHARRAHPNNNVYSSRNTTFYRAERVCTKIITSLFLYTYIYTQQYKYRYKFVNLHVMYAGPILFLQNFVMITASTDFQSKHLYAFATRAISSDRQTITYD